jgi:hypothetical protein
MSYRLGGEGSPRGQVTAAIGAVAGALIIFGAALLKDQGIISRTTEGIIFGTSLVLLFVLTKIARKDVKQNNESNSGDGSLSG